MTYQDVRALVESFSLPCAYYQFPADTAQPPPFLCWFFSGSDDFFADDRNYQRIRQLNLELYTARKAFDLEEEIESRLEALNVPYYKEEVYLDKERMHMTSYEMALVINTQKEVVPNA